MRLFKRGDRKMTQSLEKSRMDLARNLAEMDFLLRSLLPREQYQQASRRLSMLMRSSSAYIADFHDAKRQSAGHVLAPRFLTPKMHLAMLEAQCEDPVQAWHAALREAGIE